jgi:ferrous iron transport protein B
MATRTLESERDRKMTILLIPLISCSAKLPVYVLFAGAFFPQQAGNVIFSVYLLGIAVAIGVAQILRRTLFRQEVAPFVMELPPYRIPTVKSVVMHMWERASIYLRKIGGVILIASMVIWALGYFPRLSPDVLEVNTPSPDQVEILNQAHYKQAQLTYSMIGRIGQAISPAIEPLGFDWRLGVSILTGFAAKEIVVSTLGVLYQINDEVDGESVTLAEELKQPEHSISPLTAYAFMVFVLLYTPCLGTVIAIRREAGNRMMVFSVLYQLALAWLFAFIVYQGGLIIGLN